MPPAREEPPDPRGGDGRASSPDAREAGRADFPRGATLNELAEVPGFKRNFDRAVQDGKITLAGDFAQAAADSVFETPTLPDPRCPIVTP
ncbi:hypothetical protein ACIOJE_37440 [Kitasatospora sp. NPDC087861]|uniref:hypothetical protein n=1 Tax=Kitasatospora sp. NPDC087861 TaxID=3364070 RepID=UPI003810DB76